MVCTANTYTHCLPCSQCPSAATSQCHIWSSVLESFSCHPAPCFCCLATTTTKVVCLIVALTPWGVGGACFCCLATTKTKVVWVIVALIPWGGGGCLALSQALPSKGGVEELIIIAKTFSAFSTWSNQIAEQNCMCMSCFLILWKLSTWKRIVKHRVSEIDVHCSWLQKPVCSSASQLRVRKKYISKLNRAADTSNTLKIESNSCYYWIEYHYHRTGY